MRKSDEIAGYSFAESFAASCLVEAKGDVREACRLARDYLAAPEKHYQTVRHIIEGMSMEEATALCARKR